MRETLKLALDALKSIKWVNSFNEGDYLTCNFKSVETSITAIKEALAQPELEPVAWITEKISGPTKGYMTVTFNKDTGWKDARSIPLYERPSHRKPLTDDQIAEFAERMEASDPTDSFWREFARAIEAAHGIK